MCRLRSICYINVRNSTDIAFHGNKYRLNIDLHYYYHSDTLVVKVSYSCNIYYLKFKD